jgi:hypothetical protein
VTTAHPDSTTSNAETEEPTPLVETNPLSAHEMYLLTLYKWRYSLEAYGFNQEEVRDLMFLKWLYASRRVQP